MSYDEALDEGREGCCFPDECLMPGLHLRSECHTAEMMEAIDDDADDELGSDVICERCGALVRWEDCPRCGGDENGDPDCPRCEGEGSVLVCDDCGAPERQP